MKIPSNPERVCTQHAAEFWSGLLAYAGGRTDASASESELRAAAIAAAGPAPRDDEHFSIALAS
jgi:hypothetical protein